MAGSEDISSTYRILIGKPVLKDTLRRVRSVREDSVNTELQNMFWGAEVSGAGLEHFPTVGFVICGVEPLGSFTTVLDTIAEEVNIMH
jgi:hypothetical protein